MPSDNKRNVTSVFTINLENGNSDQGTIHMSVDTKKKHKFYKKKVPKKIQEQTFGIYNANTKVVIRYCDTLPTW